MKKPTNKTTVKKPTGKKATKRANPTISVNNVDQISTEVCRRVRELRRSHDWSLEALSAACGVSRSMLSQIERDEANPTLAVTARIAQAFGMSLGELVESPQASTRIHVIRANDREYHYRSDSDCSIRTLSPLHLEKDVEFYELEIKIGCRLNSAAHFERTREFITVQKGRLRITSGQEDIELNRGDSASYPADVPHCVVNEGRSTALAFLVVIYE
jgi:transcriptional regulator with XRE-family HTH domain